MTDKIAGADMTKMELKMEARRLEEIAEKAARDKAEENKNDDKK
jgi:hypothetical protein